MQLLHVHMCMLPALHARACAHTHTLTHKHTHKHKLACHLLLHARARVRACARAHTHTLKHTHTSTHTHTGNKIGGVPTVYLYVNEWNKSFVKCAVPLDTWSCLLMSYEWMVKPV